MISIAVFCLQNLICLLFISAEQVFIEWYPTLSVIFVCDTLQSFVVNVCTLLESSFWDISFFIHAPPSKDEGFLNRVAQNCLQRSWQNWTPQAFKGADKKIRPSNFIFQRTHSNRNWAFRFQPSVLVGRQGPVQKNNKQTLENKEGWKLQLFC